MIYCVLGPKLAAHVHFQLKTKKNMQSAALFFENREMAVTLPTAALSGSGFGSLQCETGNATSRYLRE